MPEGGGGAPRDRVGTLIRNKNLESNFLTLWIRFLFKVPHLGEGFEFSVSHQTENFKPSEVKNYVLAFDKTFIDCAAPNSHTTKASKTSFNLTLFSLIISLS